MDVEYKCCVEWTWVELVWDRVQCWAFVLAVLNLWTVSLGMYRARQQLPLLTSQHIGKEYLSINADNDVDEPTDRLQAIKHLPGMQSVLGA